MRQQYYTRGVTLIELMIALVVVAILAAIAVPSYRSYILRAQRTEARTALLRVQAAQERFLLQQNRYATDAELEAAPPAGLGQPRTTEGNKYGIAIVNAATPTEYNVTATALASGGQQDDSKCVLLRIDHNGVKYAADSGGTDTTRDCWR
ncbi:MAG: type IV pilin protein [Pseudomonadales bacterium]|nr:type IV pilin protein [Pseudomonadales bacterium]